MTDLARLPGRNDSNAFGINNRGQVVASRMPEQPDLPHAFLFETRGDDDLGTLPGTTSEGVGITGRATSRVTPRCTLSFDTRKVMPTLVFTNHFESAAPF